MLAVTISAPPAASAAAAPPDGTYNYVEMEKGKKVAQYVVSVKRSGATIDVKGELTPFVTVNGLAMIDSKAAIDASTLDLLSYHEMDSIGCGAVPVDLTVAGSSAKIGDKSLGFPGIEHFVLDDDRAVPILLPAEIAVWSDDRAVSVAPIAAVGHVIEPYPMAPQPQRPATVPASDRYVAMHALGAKSGSSGLWYDPRTFVVDEVDTATGQWLRRAEL
jgi:hypothetical protein